MGESCIQRRQGQSAVAIDFDELAAGTEQNHGSKLGIDAAAENEFVAFQSHHGLNRHAGELVRASFLGY